MARDELPDIHAIFDELENANDRAVGIVGTALLEHALQEALSSELNLDSKSELERSSLYATILRAYSLKIIGHITRQDFRLIRTIRNEFAHNMNPVKFTDPHTAEHFNKIKRIDSLHIDDTEAIRARFIRLIELYSSSLIFQSHVGLKASNHPPAEPGAFRYEPLKAASGSLRGPDR